MPDTDAPLANPGLLGRVLDWLRAHSEPESEVTAFTREDLRHMAEDLSLAESDLRSVAAAGRDNTALMEGMIRARGIDPAQLRHGFTTLLRDVERVCTQCKSTRRCRRELAAGTAADHAHEYCPNAGTFDDVIGYNMGR